jgi:hypothetical protein
LWAAVRGKQDVVGQQRRNRRDQGKGLAGKSTLNRLELSAAQPSEAERYKKIAALEEVQKIVSAVRKKFPRLRIILRADSGFCRPQIMKPRFSSSSALPPTVRAACDLALNRLNPTRGPKWQCSHHS